ncbi:MAG TPA: hypothetical protein VLW50_12360 [Streptosporangiaceae bacterium]|nr:hypothetical protein [Streptosporangiaceae bacterium]
MRKTGLPQRRRLGPVSGGSADPAHDRSDLAGGLQAELDVLDEPIGL